MTGELERFFTDARRAIDAQLDRIVPAEHVPPASVHAAIRWSLLAPGKRLRPVLLVAVGEAFGALLTQLLQSACAFELIHTYSLIHDDLPSMDNDDLRRGRPTCHVRYGEAIAILAGDALQALAFQIIAEDETLSAAIRLRVIAELARAAGTPAGMVAGQAYDLAAEARPAGGVTSEELELIHRHKTGAIISAAARCGAIIANATASELECITNYARALGLLFQITDDLLDVTATAADLGKTPGKDARAVKATYPLLYGIEQTRLRARASHAEAREWLDRLDRLERPTTRLGLIADLILERRG